MNVEGYNNVRELLEGIAPSKDAAARLASYLGLLYSASKAPLEKDCIQIGILCRFEAEYYFGWKDEGLQYNGAWAKVIREYNPTIENEWDDLIYDYCFHLEQVFLLPDHWKLPMDPMDLLSGADSTRALLDSLSLGKH